jgi:hypothetical protein
MPIAPCSAWPGPGALADVAADPLGVARPAGEQFGIRGLEFLRVGGAVASSRTPWAAPSSRSLGSARRASSRTAPAAAQLVEWETRTLAHLMKAGLGVARCQHLPLVSSRHVGRQPRAALLHHDQTNQSPQGLPGAGLGGRTATASVGADPATPAGCRGRRRGCRDRARGAAVTRLARLPPGGRGGRPSVAGQRLAAAKRGAVSGCVR